MLDQEERAFDVDVELAIVEASPIWAIGTNSAMPALMNRTSMWPCFALTWSTNALMAATLRASESSTSMPGSLVLAASTQRSLEPMTITVTPSDLKSFHGLRAARWYLR